MAETPETATKPPEEGTPSEVLIPPPTNHFDGVQVDVISDEATDRRLASIEMAGEEVAAGWKPTPHEPLSPEVRYLHVSRTIHELITDRNRSVGIFLFMASLLVGASTAILNVPEKIQPMVPVRLLQLWCLPATFGTLAVVGAFISLILIRTRIGLIYEVAKMNALLGLPPSRVKRVNPLSIFFLMHLLVVLLGAVSAGLTVAMLASWNGHAEAATLPEDAERMSGSMAGWVMMLVYLFTFQATYYLTILRGTRETDLARVNG